VLQTVHPGSSVEEVQGNTGFPLKVSSSFRVTPGPSERELSLLRTVVRDKMKRIYPDFAEKKIRVKI